MTLIGNDSISSRCAMWTGRYPLTMPFVEFHYLHLEEVVGVVLIAKNGRNSKYPASIRILNKASVFRRIGRLVYGVIRTALHPTAFFQICSLNEIKYTGMALGKELRHAEAHLVEFATNAFIPVFLKSIGLLKGRIYVHFHGHDASSKLDGDDGFRKRLLRALNIVDGIIVVSEWQKKKLVSYNVDVSKIDVIPCGAVISEEVTILNDDICTFTYLGRFLPQKGVMETLKAFHLCLQESHNKKMTLNLIGGGSLRSEMEEYISENNLHDHVKIHGYLPHDKAMDFLRHSSVYVQHSQTTEEGWVEGWGVSLAEASGYGLPIISTRHGGIVDHQIDGVTGYLVEEGDWRSMAQRMKALAESPKLRSELGANGRLRIQKVGNLNVQLKKLTEALFPGENL